MFFFQVSSFFVNMICMYGMINRQRTDVSTGLKNWQLKKNKCICPEN